MTKPDPGSVTGLQLDVLRALWAAPNATVADVQAALAVRRELAATTVATLLKRLAKRGLVAHVRDGRQFRYRALVAESDVLRRTVDDVAEQVFAGDVAAFAAQLLAREDVDATDLAKIRGLIEARERELGS